MTLQDFTLISAADRGFERQAGRDIILGLRPEAITDRDGADRSSRAVEVVEAPVEVTEPAGSGVDVRAGHVHAFAVNMEKAVAFDPKTEMRIS